MKIKAEAEQPTNNHQPDTNNGVWYSVALHFMLLSILILQNVFFDSEKINYESAIRVDIVGLPEKYSPEKTPPPTQDLPSDTTPPAEPAKAEPKTETKLPEKKQPIDEAAVKITPDLKPKETMKKAHESSVKKQKEALEKIKKMSAIEKIKSELDAEKKSNAQEDSKKMQFKGHVLNPGTELTGLNKIQHENYVTLLDKKIKENWALPQWLSQKELKAQALIKIDDNGVLIYNQIYKSSGNSSYDDFVLETINKSAPFPKPPEKFLAIVGVRGILIGFPE